MGINYNPRTVTDGLVLALDAGNTKSYPGSGTTWTDLSGRGNNGTLTNGVGYNSSNLGSLSFDGVDDYVINSSTTGMPTGNSDRTIQFWVYPVTDISSFVQLGTGGAGFQLYLVQFYNNNGTIILFTDSKNASNNINISGSELPILNTWNYITFGNSGQNWFYYVNGSLKKTGTWDVTLDGVGQKYVIGKGEDYIRGSGEMNGNIAQVSIYNRALTAAEIQQNFNALRGRFSI